MRGKYRARVPGCFWAFGLPMVLGGLGAVAYGVLCTVVAVNERIDTAAELETYGARLTKGVLLVTGGVLACMIGVHVCRAGWRQGGVSSLGHVLLVGGYLLVVTGLIVFTRHTSMAGFCVGFGIQVVGAVAVGVGGSGSGSGTQTERHVVGDLKPGVSRHPRRIRDSLSDRRSRFRRNPGCEKSDRSDRPPHS